jgi:hypothetical protein
MKNRLTPYILSIAATALTAIVLFAQGRIWWCKFGDTRIYVNEAWNSSHTSQHLLDPYTFTHILHGVLFFWIATWLFANWRRGWRFLLAAAAECAWEVFENSTYVIEKYRENTASLDYFGDSIANSVGDVLACATGYLIAKKLGAWPSLIFFVLVELTLLIWIRDSLLLNVVMLIYPSNAIKAWQLGAF